MSSAATSAYFVFPLVKNNLDAPSTGINVNQISLTDFAVDITPIGSVTPQTQALFDALNADGNERWMIHTKSVWSGSVSSGGGLISAKVNGVPVELANRLRATQEVRSHPISRAEPAGARVRSHEVQGHRVRPFRLPRLRL